MNDDKRARIKCVLGFVAAATALTLVIYGGVLIYKKCKADRLLEEAGKATEDLRGVIVHSRNCIKNNKFLMTGPAETAPLVKEVEEVDESLVAVEASLFAIKSSRSIGNIDAVNDSLESASSPIKRAAELSGRLRSKVIGYCNEKRSRRDAAVDNEWFLKARLKKPIDPTLQEKPEDLQDMPTKFFVMIPKSTEEFVKNGLASLSPEQSSVMPPLWDGRLFNSLGSNLVTHKLALDHILQFGKTDKIKEKASKMYCGAMDHYIRVREENDRLSVWYKAQLHDGKYSMDDYKKLLSEQEIPLNDIHQGDNLLRALTAYLNELHEQYYVYVSAHRKQSTSFSHLRSRTRTSSRINSQGHSETYTETYWETYYTDGYKYFYTLTTVRPGTKTDEEIYVGEKDSTWFEWEYSTEETVGWVRKWKRLHEDNSMIKRGWAKDLTPLIEQE
jgi:hypothetical protein